MLNEYEKELVKEMLSEMKNIIDHKDDEGRWERIKLIANMLTEGKT